MEEPLIKRFRHSRHHNFRKEEQEKREAEAPTSPKNWKVRYSDLVLPDTFDEAQHFYPRVLNAHLHPMVGAFLRLGNTRIASRYCHLNPNVDEKWLLDLLNKGTQIFQWSGADLFNVTNSVGSRQMIIIETNSCPSGQKSMPLPIDSEDNSDGYHKLIKNTFMPALADRQVTGSLPEGGLAVIYDKNDMEASGYACALANVAKETVYLTKFIADDPDPSVMWNAGVMHVRKSDNAWIPIRATFRYVTQRPWTRIPLASKTLIINPVVACLAGGRNKMAADKAYEFFNKEIVDSGLAIRVPETIRDVKKEEVPLWVKSMGGKAVIKSPYSNAGQGVYTVINEEELQRFMTMDSRYEKYIVQALVGHGSWSSATRKGVYYHTGTIPNVKNSTFVADLRMMICSTPSGFMPLAVYARRAAMPLISNILEAKDSWQMLGTNLSKRNEDGTWVTETNRLLLMDSKDFNRLGLGTDDLIDAYVQTVLATTAIDSLAARLHPNDAFDFELFSSLNADDTLLDEIEL